MAEENINNRQRDMILAPNEFAYIIDETKGEVNVYVGPNKQSLAGTDRCVLFDLKTKRFTSIQLDKGIQTFQTAPEGWYIILKNPADGDRKPSGNGKLSTPELKVGKKVNISGPANFALWPGQMAKVVEGHKLRSNEYLLVRVYDEAAAKANIDNMVIKTVGTVDDGAGSETAKQGSDDNKAGTAKNTLRAENLSMGNQFIIRGTEVSFYIPPTGIEVVPEKINGEERFIREAVSLERLEYCLLLDQDGTKRYVQGPDVVFPQPTEKFVEAPIKSSPDKAKAKKFRAQELTPASGIHIRVIADYEDDDGTKYKAGEELFVTGKTQTIYYPREEHSIIKYGEQDIHYGIAIPTGEARYVLDRLSGVISLVRGPQIFLPDPRTQVIAQRALPLNLCGLLYPGNQEALEINAARAGIEDQDFIGAGGGGTALLNNGDLESSSYAAASAVATPDTTRRMLIRGASKSLPGDAFDRKNKFTAPRSVVLNTKYDGAVSSDIWPGFAMLLVSKSGTRRVEQGPTTVIFEYDESPQVMTLSRGKPKTMDNPLKTAFLLTKANIVSDIVTVETKDFISCNVKLSYRVNFEGDDPEKWFAVDNYVKFLCDHLRSRLRSATQKYGIEEFHANHTEILRDVVLGKATDKGRTGMTFVENNMRIYDLEVLEFKIMTPDIEKFLVSAQRDVISNTLRLAGERRQLGFTIESEELKRQSEEAKTATLRQTYEVQAENAKLKLQLDLAQIDANAKAELERITAAYNSAKAQGDISELELEQAKLEEEQKLAFDTARQTLELAKLEAQTQALANKAKAISPDLIAALQSFGDKAMVEKVSEAMAPLAILGGGSVVDVAKKLLEGTTLANVMDVAKARSNGTKNASA